MVSGPILLLPNLRDFSLQNFSAVSATRLPKSFPVPLKDRDDFFCVDPKSLSIEQINKYKKEMLQLINVEKNNLEQMTKNSNACIDAYNRGLLLAQETMRSKSTHRQTRLHTPSLLSHDEPIGYIDPKSLTTTQLQLYIEGINEEITYEKKLINEFQKESTSRIDAYQTGIQHANYELSIRKGK